MKLNLFQTWHKLHVMSESVQDIHSSDGCHFHFTEVNKENNSGRKKHLALCAMHPFSQKLELLIHSIMNVVDNSFPCNWSLLIFLFFSLISLDYFGLVLNAVSIRIYLVYPHWWSTNNLMGSKGHQGAWLVLQFLCCPDSALIWPFWNK